MKRHKITLGENIYLIDYFNVSETKDKVLDNFIILRKYEYSDQMTFDSDVYVIYKNVWESYKEGKINLVFPYTYANTNNLTTIFSNKIEQYNQNFYYNDNDLCDITNNDGTSANIECDKIRIYHPHTKTNQQLIIYVDAYIHNVHFHIYCREISDLPTYSFTEIEINNIYYSEYIEFNIPNIEKLFYNTYYNDILNSIVQYPDSSCVPMSLFKTNFKIIEENGIFYKDYVTDPKEYCLDSSKFVNNINVTLYPYTEIDNDSNIYILDNDILSGTTSFANNVKFSLSAKFELNELPMILCEFVLPENSPYNDFISAYEYYNNVSLNEYKGIIYEDTEDDDEELAEKYGDVSGEEMKLCGYKLVLSSDVDFKNILYEETNWDYEFDNFSFQLNKIFVKWNEYPDVIVAKAQFIDRYLGNIIESNQVMITKEMFKYLINDIYNINRIHLPK